jgi:hypothetical protein
LKWGHGVRPSIPIANGIIEVPEVYRLYKTRDRYVRGSCTQGRIVMPRMKPILITLLLSGVLVGCKDSPTVPAEPLNEAEARALYRGLFRAGSNSLHVVATETRNRAVSDCPLGGEMAAMIDVEATGAGSDTSFIMVFDPADCVIRSEGYRFTLDGSPNVRIEMTGSSAGQSSSTDLDMTATGQLDWQLDDRSGSCVFDFSISMEFDVSQLQRPRQETDGTLCGLTMDLDPIGPPV